MGLDLSRSGLCAEDDANEYEGGGCKTQHQTIHERFPFFDHFLFVYHVFQNLLNAYFSNMAVPLLREAKNIKAWL